MSEKCKSTHVQTLDIVCPVIAGLTYSLGKLSENSHDYYLTLGAISPDF